MPEVIIQPLAPEGTSQRFPLSVVQAMVTVSAVLSLGFYVLNELVCGLIDELVGLFSFRLAQ